MTCLIDFTTPPSLINMMNAGAGGEAIIEVVDVDRPEEIIALMEHTVSYYGRIDTLINNAGLTVIKSPVT